MGAVFHFITVWIPITLSLEPVLRLFPPPMVFAANRSRSAERGAVLESDIGPPPADRGEAKASDARLLK